MSLFGRVESTINPLKLDPDVQRESIQHERNFFNQSFNGLIDLAAINRRTETYDEVSIRQNKCNDEINKSDD